MDGQALSRASRVKGLSFRANTAKFHIKLEIIREIFPTACHVVSSLSFVLAIFGNSKVVEGNNRPVLSDRFESHEYL